MEVERKVIMELKEILKIYTESLKTHYLYSGDDEPVDYDWVVECLYIFLENSTNQEDIAYEKFKEMCNNEKSLIDNLVKEINQEFNPSKEEIVIKSLQRIRIEYEKIYSFLYKKDGYPEQDALVFMDVSICDLEQQYGIK